MKDTRIAELFKYCKSRNIEVKVTECKTPNCIRLIVSGKNRSLIRDILQTEDIAMHFESMINLYIKRERNND